MGQRTADWCSRGRGEDASRPILAADDDPRTVPAECRAQEAFPMWDWIADGLARRDRPEPDRRSVSPTRIVVPSGLIHSPSGSR